MRLINIIIVASIINISAFIIVYAVGTVLKPMPPTSTEYKYNANPWGCDNEELKV